MIVKQSSIVASKPPPEESDSTKFVIHAPVPSTSIVVKIPEPEGITEPVKLKPKTVLLPVETVKPLA